MAASAAQFDPNSTSQIESEKRFGVTPEAVKAAKATRQNRAAAKVVPLRVVAAA
jgi:hypothetical protein